MRTFGGIVLALECMPQDATRRIFIADLRLVGHYLHAHAPTASVRLTCLISRGVIPQAAARCPAVECWGRTCCRSSASRDGAGPARTTVAASTDGWLVHAIGPRGRGGACFVPATALIRRGGRKLLLRRRRRSVPFVVVVAFVVPFVVVPFVVAPFVVVVVVVVVVTAGTAAADERWFCSSSCRRRDSRA
jgi:hypothetical protein